MQKKLIFRPESTKYSTKEMPAYQETEERIGLNRNHKKRKGIDAFCCYGVHWLLISELISIRTPPHKIRDTLLTASEDIRLLLDTQSHLYLFPTDASSKKLPTDIIPSGKVKAMGLLPLYHSSPDCRESWLQDIPLS